MASSGTLWVVATPIGNLEDLAPRAVQVLQHVAVVAAEDTRHTRPLLSRFGISTPLLAYHEHNEDEMSARLIERLRGGEDVALVSDAGTPLICDPGYRLVAAARGHALRVSTVPGPCAAVAALSIAGLPCERFAFEGFLPAKSAARRERLRALAGSPHTLVFYEAKHRIVETLVDLCAEFGGERRAAVMRELTKLHETTLDGTLDAIRARVEGDPHQQLGEFVLVVAGAPASGEEADRAREGERVFRLLREELPPGRAAKLAAEITGASRNALYRLL